MRQQPAWLPATVCFSVAIIIYFFTLAPDLTFANFGGDGGELITASTTLGIPHPPGYPTYVVLGKLFSYLPVGTIAYRYNLFSAICMAGAATFVCLSALAINDNKWIAALLAGLTFATAPLVWGQATITEVYGLNALFLGATIWASLSGKRPIFVGLLLGLATTTHLTSLLILPALIFPYPITAKKIINLLFGILLGLTPFLLLPIFASTNSPAEWGNANTIAGWWWIVSGKIYQPNLLSYPQEKLILRALDWFPLIFKQFFWLGLPIIISLQVVSKSKQFLWLILSACLFLVYAFLYDAFDAIVFFLPFIFIMSIGLGSISNKMSFTLLPLLAFLVYVNWSAMNLSSTQFLRTSTESAFATIPAEAILITPGNRTISAVWYYHFVEQQRTDMITVDSNLFAFDWYREQLNARYPSLDAVSNDDVPLFIQENGKKRPICTISLIEPLQLNCTN